MTPNNFVLEYWKVYEAYMGRKEHLIEVTTTLYLAFVSALSALLLQDQSVLRQYVVPVFILWFITMVLVWWFIIRQFGYWTNAARICNSSQTLMAEWLVKSPAAEALSAVDEPSFPEVKVPKALADEIEKRRTAWGKKACCKKVCSSPFQVIVYGLGVLWTLAFVGVAYLAYKG